MIQRLYIGRLSEGGPAWPSPAVTNSSYYHQTSVLRWDYKINQYEFYLLWWRTAKTQGNWEVSEQQQFLPSPLAIGKILNGSYSESWTL